jgi:hypothetical protein
MQPDETTNSYVTPRIEEAATLHALGCPILTAQTIRASDLARYVQAGYYVREGSIGFVCSAERADFAEVLQTIRHRLAKVPVAAYQDGINICKRLVKESERHGGR